MVGYRQTLNLSYPLPEEKSNMTDSTSCDAQDDVETSAVLGLIVSLMPVGGLFGALIAGVVSDFAGRKPAVIAGGIFVLCSSALHVAAINLWMVLLSRIIAGVGIGILLQVTPMYVAEISPEKLRGRLSSLTILYGYMAIVIGSIINLAMNNFLFGWRISLGVQFVMGIVLALGMFLLPRSPRWLANNLRDGESLKVLIKIYKDPVRAQTQLEEIKSTVSSSKEPLIKTLKYIIQWKMIQRALLGFFLLFLGRFSGLNFILYFSVTLLCGIGLPGFAVSFVLTAVAVSSILLSVVVIDKLGRKPLMLIGTAVSCASHLLSASLLVAFDLEGSAMGEVSFTQRMAGYFVLTSLCVYMAFAVPSIGNASWIIVNEMFPLRGRGFMTSVANCGFWVGFSGSSQIYSVLIRSPLKISGTLYLFAIITFILFLYVLLLLPETKGQTLEKVEELFSKPWLERTNVLYYLRCGCFKELWEGTGDHILAVAVDQDSPTKSSLSVSDEPSLMDQEKHADCDDIGQKKHADCDDIGQKKHADCDDIGTVADHNRDGTCYT